MSNLHISVLLARIGSLRVYKLGHLELTFFRGIINGVFKRNLFIRWINIIYVRSSCVLTWRVNSYVVENGKFINLSCIRQRRFVLRVRSSSTMNIPRHILLRFVGSFLRIGIITILRIIPNRFIILNAHDSAFVFPQEF